MMEQIDCKEQFKSCISPNKTKDNVSSFMIVFFQKLVNNVKWWFLPRLPQQTLRLKILVFTLMQQPLKQYANDADVQWLAFE